MRLFKFQPGSVLWLFMHEYRLFFYEMGDGGKKAISTKSTNSTNNTNNTKKIVRGLSRKVCAFFAVIWLAMHYLAWKLLSEAPAIASAVTIPMLWITSFVLVMLTTFMLSSALNRSVKALFERGDLDLLLSSPLATQTIFTVRLAAIVVGISALYALFFSPLINVGVVSGHVAWLAAYPVLFGIAMLSSSVAMLLTLGLVKLIGVKRTHTVAHLLGALTGAIIFLVSQTFSHIDTQLRQKILSTVLSFLDQYHLLTANSWLWMPARAVFGEVSGAAAIFFVGLICCWLTTRYTHHFFVRGVQQAGSTDHKNSTGGVVTTQSSTRVQRRFYQNIWLVMLIKEWRLLFRDIELLAQICLQLLYMLPLFFVIFKQGVQLSSVASGLTYLAISLAGSLIWVIVSAEDMPDLLHCSPVPARQLRYAKLVAAIAPVYLLLAPVIGWLCWHDLSVAFALSFSSLCGVLGTVLIYHWLGKSATRDRFKRRGQGNIIPVLLETLNAISWTAISAGFLVTAKLAWFGFAGAGCVLIVAWLLRVRRT
ncbi:hypothetical protein [Undibacterium sp. RuRC25W]|uniref:hypothetical protein n=1 Tax=Undibacterium sp. RuRC25W TaxID=3413047 RepID=UPI003BF32481